MGVLLKCSERYSLTYINVYLELCEHESIIDFGYAVRLLKLDDSVHSLPSYSVHHHTHILLHLPAILIQAALQYNQEVTTNQRLPPHISFIWTKSVPPSAGCR